MNIGELHVALKNAEKESLREVLSSIGVANGYVEKYLSDRFNEDAEDVLMHHIMCMVGARNKLNEEAFDFKRKLKCDKINARRLLDRHMELVMVIENAQEQIQRITRRVRKLSASQKNNNEKFLNTAASAAELDLKIKRLLALKDGKRKLTVPLRSVVVTS